MGDDADSMISTGGSRATLCVSSEVGCQMGCTFCATGTMGLKVRCCPASGLNGAFALSHDPTAALSALPDVSEPPLLDTCLPCLRLAPCLAHQTESTSVTATVKRSCGNNTQLVTAGRPDGGGDSGAAGARPHAGAHPQRRLHGHGGARLAILLPLLPPCIQLGHIAKQNARKQVGMRWT